MKKPPIRRALALAAVLVLLVAVGLGVATRGDDADSMTVTAQFEDASPLLEGNDVRLDGVKVGTIDSIEVTDAGADVTLELDKTAMPLHLDATAIIRPVSLLGERFVDLDRGSPEEPELRDGGVLPVGATGAPTDLDQVLSTFDDPTAAALAGLVSGLGKGFDGNGENVAAALKALGPAFADTEQLATVLSEQNVTISTLVASMEQVSMGVATRKGVALDELVTATEQLLGTTASNEAAFRSFLAELPSTLSAARTTLAQLETTAGQTTPTLKQMRPTTSQLEEISTELKSFADAADPALRGLNPVLARADELLKAAQPVAELLRQQGGATKSDVASLDALSSELAPEFRTVMEFFKGWALATNSRDGLAHYFRAGTVLTSYTVTGAVPPLGAPDAGPPGPQGPSEPSLPDLPDFPLGDVQGLLDDVGGLGGLLSNRTDKGGGVTGLTSSQETDALAFLLGGN